MTKNERLWLLITETCL